jgi:hypothetical protein
MPIPSAVEFEQDPAFEEASGGKNARELPAPANDAQEDTVLAGRSAREVAEFALGQCDLANEGMHFGRIFDYATRFGWEGYNRDTIRRTLNKHRDQFEFLGKGRYRLKERE